VGKDNNNLIGKGEHTMSVPAPKIKQSNQDNRPCSPAQSLAESLKEMELISQGKLKKRTWNELKKSLK
jgi:hypothetical protein